VMEVVDLGWFAEVLGCDPGAASGVAGVAADAGGPTVGSGGDLSVVPGAGEGEFVDVRVAAVGPAAVGVVGLALAGWHRAAWFAAAALGGDQGEALVGAGQAAGAAEV